MGQDAQLACVLLILGWTGLWWGEARAVQFGDLMEVPTPGLLISRSVPEGVGTKAPKGNRSRRVPIANRILPFVRQFADGKERDELLLRTLQGARLHDLRHTAACP